MKLKLLTLATSVALSIQGCDESPPPFTELPADYDGTVEDLNPSDDLKGYASVASAQWTFNASDIDDVEVEFDLESDRIKQYGTMKDQTISAAVKHEQITRPQKVEVFQQGTDAQYVSEFFKQNENDDAQGLLDVLVVIDNSGSMAEEQENLSSKMLPLLSYVAESDWRIGVVTTDVADGCLRDLIQKNQSNPQAAFSNAIRAGTSGSGIEAGVPQAVKALSPDCLNGNSWLRPNSTLAVLIVSDEDNCSDGTKCSVPEYNSGDYLIDHLATIREVGVNAKVFGLIWHSSQSQSQCRTAYRQGLIYSDMIAETGGSWGSICDSDYSSTLQAMSLDLSLILKTQFALQYSPFKESLEVFVNNVKVSSGYSLTGNVVEFNEAPPPGAKISMNYRFSTAEPQKNFSLTGNADGNNMTVYLDGRATTDYTYDAASKQLKFDRPPQARQVKVTYKEMGNLIKDFAVEPQIEETELRVAVNDRFIDSSNYSYNKTTGVVSFSVAPQDGAIIEMKYERVIGPMLEYPVFAPSDAMGSVVVYDKFGSPIPVTVVDQEIVFNQGDFTKGKSFTIEYDNYAKDLEIIDIGYMVYDNSLNVTGSSSGECGSFQLADTLVDISNCGFNSTENILFKFQFVKEHLSEFSLETDEYDLDKLMNSDYTYGVSVNDKPTDQFEVEGNVIRFKGELPIGAVVTVKLFRGHDS